MNVYFSVVGCIREFRVLQFLGLADTVVVYAESCARIYVAQNSCFRGVDQD